MLFQHEMKVRDYECDMQGVVNNANYQHYLEVTRHEWMQSFGQSFGEWHSHGVDAMVSRITLDYKVALHGGEPFLSCITAVKREGPRFMFHQEIRRKADDKLCVKALVEVVTVVDGKLSRGDEAALLLQEGGVE